MLSKIFILCLISGAVSINPVKVGVLLALSCPGFVSQGAVMLALNTSIKVPYEVVLEDIYPKCDTNDVQATVESILRLTARGGGVPVDIILGPNYDNSATVAIPAVQSYNIPIVSWVTIFNSNDQLANPMSFEAVPSDEDQGYAFLNLFKQMQWKNVNVLALSNLEIDGLVGVIRYHNSDVMSGMKITVSTIRSASEAEIGLRDLMSQSNSYIYLLAVTNVEIVTVLTACQKLGLTKAPYQLLGVFQVMRAPQIFTINSFRSFLPGIIGVIPGVTNMTRFQEVKKLWQDAYLTNPNTTLKIPPSNSITTGYFYDAAQVAALAINQYYDEGKPAGKRFAEILMGQKIDDGVLGKFEWSAWRVKKSIYSVVNMINENGTLATVATISGDINKGWKFQQTGQILFSTGINVPIDSPPVPKYDPSITKLLSYVFVVIGVLFACSLLAILAIFRNHPTILASSVPFCFNIVFGYILSVITVAIMQFEYPPSDGGCKSAMIIGHVSFVSIFGSLFLKTYRIYKIFNQSKVLHVVKINNTHLTVILLALVTILCTILGFCMGFMKLTPNLLVVDEVSYIECSTDNSVWIWAILSIELMFTVYGTYLAIKVANVPMEFNESRYIAICIYQLVAFGGLCLAVLELTNMTPFIKRYVTACAVFFLSLCIVATIFIPKISHIIKGGIVSIKGLTTGSGYQSDNTSGEGLGLAGHVKNAPVNPNARNVTVLAYNNPVPSKNTLMKDSHNGVTINVHGIKTKKENINRNTTETPSHNSDNTPPVTEQTSSRNMKYMETFAIKNTCITSKN